MQKLKTFEEYLNEADDNINPKTGVMNKRVNINHPDLPYTETPNKDYGNKVNFDDIEDPELKELVFQFYHMYADIKETLDIIKSKKEEIEQFRNAEFELLNLMGKFEINAVTYGDVIVKVDGFNYFDKKKAYASEVYEYLKRSNTLSEEAIKEVKDSIAELTKKYPYYIKGNVGIYKDVKESFVNTVKGAYEKFKNYLSDFVNKMKRTERKLDEQSQVLKNIKNVLK